MVREVLSYDKYLNFPECAFVLFSDDYFLSNGIIETFNKLSFYIYSFHDTNIDCINNNNVVLIIDSDLYNTSEWKTILLVLKKLNVVKIIWLCDVTIGRVFPIPYFSNEYVFMNNSLDIFAKDLTLAFKKKAKDVYRPNFNFNELSYIYRIIYFRHYRLHDMFPSKLNYKVRSDVCAKIGLSNWRFFEYFIRKNSFFFRFFWYPSIINYKK